MKKTLLVLAALAAPLLAHAQDVARPISLDDAIALAKKNAPTMISARGQIRTSSASLRQAKWAYNPLNNIVLSYGSSISGGAAYINDIKIDRPASSWNFNQGFGNASLTIWDGGTKHAAIKTADARLDQAEINEVSQEFSIVQSVKTQYYVILRQREALETARIQLANAQLQMKLAQARLSAGAATTADTLQSMLSILTANSSILSAQNNIDNANAQLTRLTASDISVTAITSDTSDPPKFQMSDATLMSLSEQAPSVRTAVAAVSVSKSQERGARAIRWPSITAGGSFGRSNSEPTHGGFTGYDFGKGPMSYNWSFNLGAQYTLFNGFSRESQLLSARVTVDNSEAALREARLTFRQNLTQDIGALNLADVQIGLARSQLAVAEENLRVVQKRYEIGSGTLLELTNAQQAVTTARNTLTNARFDARNARTALESLLGRDLPQ